MNDTRCPLCRKENFETIPILGQDDLITEVNPYFATVDTHGRDELIASSETDND